MGRVIATNKKAFHNYELTDRWECGIALAGGEVKSVRAGDVNFKGSFARVERGEVFIFNLHIAPYREASYMNEDPDRPRKLLLHRKEIDRIAAAQQQKGLALVPTKMYFNNRGLVKLEMALGRGKKRFDKREAMKKQTIDRALKRTLRKGR